MASGDYIGGVAILDRKNPDKQHLYCFGFRANKHPTFICIPVYPKGGPKPQPHAWQYSITGDSLHVTPSVRQSAGNNGPEIFHNEASWAVKFKDKDKDAYEELRAANPACSIFE